MADLPERFGNWKTVYNRHRRWSGDGIWEMILDRLRAGCDEAAGRAWTVAADATVVRAQRNVVERAFCQLRQHRAVATRYDRRDFTWRGTIDVASIRIWLRHPVP